MGKGGALSFLCAGTQHPPGPGEQAQRSHNQDLLIFFFFFFFKCNAHVNTMWRLSYTKRLDTAPCLFAIEIEIIRKTLLSKSTFFSCKTVYVRGILKAQCVLEGRG